MIEINDLTYAYLSHNVIEKVTLSIKKGEFTLIKGENGSGKTTLIKCLASLINDYQGTIKKNGTIAYLSQITEVQNNFPATIEEIVMSGTIANNPTKFFYSKADKEKCIESLKQLDLYEIRKKSFRELSGGQKQRTLLARAICQKADILILDEPTNGLDPEISVLVYKYLEKINKEQNITILMVSHDVVNSLKYASRIIEIKNGRVVFNDKVKKYKDNKGAIS